MRILLRLFKTLEPYTLHVIALLVSVLAVTITSLFTPSLIRSAIDDGLSKRDSAALFSAGALIIAIGAIRSVFNFGKRFLSEWLTNTTGYDLRNALYDKIQRLPFSFHDQTQTGQLMSRCTEDVSSLARFIGQGAVELLNVVLLFVGIIILLFQSSATLTLISIGPVIVLAVTTYYFASLIHPMFYRIDQAIGDLSATLQENLTGAQVVRAFAKEDFEKEKFAHKSRVFFRARVAVVNTWGYFMPTTTLLIMLPTVLVLWFGGHMVLDGTITLGALVAFNAYLLLLAPSVQELGFIISSAGEAVAGGQRIFEILDLREEIKSPPRALQLPPLTGRVTFENVSFSYRGARDALTDVSFEAQPNQVIALIGPTGSGKTSITNLIPRFYDPRAGRVCVDGIDVRDAELKSLRAQIGIVLQTSLLFSESIGDNIRFGRRDATMDEIRAAARAARAHEFISNFPNGYDTEVGERGITLSGGQKQRVAIARALLLNPRILILDDSMSSVDTQTEYEIQLALAALMQNRILVLDEGRIVQRGKHAELLAQGGLYKEIYDLQLKDQEQYRHEMMFLDEAEAEISENGHAAAEIETVKEEQVADD
ncbi:MAG: ABC transporter ATP-binding protein [Chloroflexi bacterium]|nr:ABC transporter ATP-binding protein [Chloroflexota bacterium]